MAESSFSVSSSGFLVEFVVRIKGRVRSAPVESTTGGPRVDSPGAPGSRRRAVEPGGSRQVHWSRSNLLIVRRDQIGLFS